MNERRITGIKRTLLAGSLLLSATLSAAEASAQTEQPSNPQPTTESTLLTDATRPKNLALVIPIALATAGITLLGASINFNPFRKDQ